MTISRIRHAAAGAPGAVRGRLRLLPALAGGVGLVAATLAVPALASPGAVRPNPQAAAGFRAACPPAPAGHLRCFTMYRAQTSVTRPTAPGASGKASKPHGLSPRNIEAAYRLPVNRHSHQTVAVSIAYNTPHLAQYLAHYRQYFGLPPCSVASGCFRVVNQKGRAKPLPPNGTRSGWDLEATLDVSMISVACPHCKIIVVEATSSSFADLAHSDDAAAKLGAQVISNSYGGRENGFALAWARSYDHPGHTTVASSGDIGFTAANFPADLSTVTAVGGTVLAPAPTKRGGGGANRGNRGGGEG